MINPATYLQNRKRLKKAETILDTGDKWQIPKYREWVDAFNDLLEENLEFESTYKIRNRWPDPDQLAKKLEKDKAV